MNAREANGATKSDFKSIYDELVVRAMMGCECAEDDYDDEGCSLKCDPGLISRAADEIDRLNHVIVNLRMLTHKIAKTQPPLEREELATHAEHIAGQVGLQSSPLRG